MFVYNISGTPNKNNQILEVVDIMLHYKTHLEQTFLIAFSLNKQDLILKFIWFKKNNLEVN